MCSPVPHGIFSHFQLEFNTMYNTTFCCSPPHSIAMDARFATAFRLNDYQEAKRLLQNTLVDVDFNVLVDGYGYLHLAAMFNYTKMMVVLLKYTKWIDVNLLDKVKHSPLEWSLLHKDRKIATMLIRHPAFKLSVRDFEKLVIRDDKTFLEEIIASGKTLFSAKDPVVERQIESAHLHGFHTLAKLLENFHLHEDSTRLELKLGSSKGKSLSEEMRELALFDGTM
jgi:hypothetical protein